MHQRMHMQALQHQQRSMNNMMWQMGMNKPIKKTSSKYKVGVITLSGDSIVSCKKQKYYFFKPIEFVTIVNKDKQKQDFRPQDTKSIFVKQKWGTVTGIPFDLNDHWIFNTQTLDSIRFYANFPEQGLEYITHYQMGDGEIVSITAETMKTLVQDSPKALKHLEGKRVNLYKALSAYMKEKQKK